MKAIKNITPLAVIVACTFSNCNTPPIEKEKAMSTDTTATRYKAEKPKIYSDTIDYNVYNKIIISDTSGCGWFRNGKEIIILKDKKVTISDIDTKYKYTLLLSTGDLNFSICNRPKEITEKNIGDTIVVSAYAYDVRGADKARGYPTVLHKVILKQTH